MLGHDWLRPDEVADDAEEVEALEAKEMYHPGEGSGVVLRGGGRRRLENVA